MKLYIKKEDCCGCGACLDCCQADAIYMVKDKEGFFYPRIDSSRCTGCSRCEKVCPVKNKNEEKYEHEYLGAQAKNDKFRFSGSSGGVFPVIADYVVRNHGYVYGAGYDEKMRVVHKEAENFEQLERIKKTKYVQSDMTGTFRDIERRLKEDCLVLFCGTACQAHALKLFLGQPYKKLIIMDLICYGVPSPGIWQDYVKYLENKHGGRMTEFYFRDKRNKDSGHTCAYVIGGKEYVGSLYRDIYCLMYFRNYILRPSCHSCDFCTVDRDSDITIGDFWGIENVKPEFDDGMGTSVVILHTEKGKEMWSQVEQKINWFKCQKEEVMQPRLLGPTNVAKSRKSFMTLYRLMPLAFFIKLKNWRKKR